MMCNWHWMSLVLNVTSSRQKSIKTATILERGMTRSFITTARIITSKSNRKMTSKNTEKVKNTDQTRSSNWDCLWTGMQSPLAFSLFPGNANEQTSLKPLEKKVLGDFGCQKFIYCSDAGLGSEAIREYNHMGEYLMILLSISQSFQRMTKDFITKTNPIPQRNCINAWSLRIPLNMPFIRNRSVTNR